MRAVVIKKFGGPEVLELSSNVALPVPAENQVRVKVECAGVNPCDTYIREGALLAPELPYTPGFDGAGTVESCGANVKKFKPGDRVYFCSPKNGSYAEYCTVPEDRIFLLHEPLTFAQGASLGIPYFTAYRALVTKAGARKGQTVLIHGASGAVGIACCQIAKRLGLKVFGTAGSEAGLELIRKNGADHAFDHNGKDYVERIKKISGDGIDLIIEMLASVNLDRDIRDLVSRSGTIVLVGSRGNISIDPFLIFHKEITVTGVMLFYTAKEEWQEIGRFFDQGQREGWLLPVIGKEYQLEDVREAHKEVMEHTGGSHGKIVLKIR